MKCPLPGVEKQKRVPAGFYEHIRRGGTFDGEYVPIKNIDIFDFDGTLFDSPSPNHSIWREIGTLLEGDSKGTKSQHKMLVEKVMDGGVGWYQSIETLLPPLVTAVSGKQQPERKGQMKRTGNSLTLCKKSANYVRGDSEDEVCIGSTDDALLYSDRTFIRGAKDVPPDSKTESAIRASRIFTTSELLDRTNPRVLQELRLSAANRSHLTIVLTGRNVLFTQIVREILQSFDIQVDHLKMKPLVIPVATLMRGNHNRIHLSDIVEFGAYNPINTITMKEEYLTNIITYYTSQIWSRERTEKCPSAIDIVDIPHIRIFEDRESHCEKFSNFLQGLLKRPLRVRPAGSNTKSEKQSLCSSAFREDKIDLAVVETPDLIPLMLQGSLEDNLCWERSISLQKHASNVFHRQFTFDIVYIKEASKSLPLEAEFAIVAHLQNVHKKSIFELCRYCCYPISKKRDSGDNQDVPASAKSWLSCQCPVSGIPTQNRYTLLISDSRDEYFRILQEP